MNGNGNGDVDSGAAFERARDVRRRRRRRGAAARQLLALAVKGALDAPERWDWDTLGSLPSWCLLDAPARLRLQRVAGLLFLGPELRLWIDRARLDEAAALVGADALDAVIDEADRRFAGSDVDGAGSVAPVAASAGADAPSLAERLDGTGAAVLLATLPDGLPIEGLGAALGEPIGTLSVELAEGLLDAAERLLVRTDERGGRDADAADGTHADADADADIGAGADAGAMDVAPA